MVMKCIKRVWAWTWGAPALMFFVCFGIFYVLAVGPDTAGKVFRGMVDGLKQVNRKPS